VVQTEAERPRAGGGGTGVSLGERLGVVVVSVHQQKLEASPAQQGTGEAEEAAPFRVARQVAEVAERDERVATLLDGAPDQAAQVASVAVNVAEDEQTAHSSRGYRAAAHGRTGRASRWLTRPSSAAGSVAGG
jgi:ABC-type tungstate transport system permease subunit